MNVSKTRITIGQKTYEFVVVQDGTVRGWKMASFFISTFTVSLGRLVFSAFAAAFGTLDIVELQVDDLMNDDTADTAWPQRIWWGVLHSVIVGIVGCSLLVLQFGRISQRFW